MTKKRTIDTTNSTAVENGAVVQMLTTNPIDPATAKDKGSSTIDPASQAKDVDSINKESLEQSKDNVEGEKDPATAKDPVTLDENESDQPIDIEASTLVNKNQISKDYLEILGSKVPEKEKSLEEENVEDDYQQQLIDKQMTLNKAMKAATEGNAEEASFLFRLHSRMIVAKPIRKDVTERVIKKVVEVIEDDVTPTPTLEGVSEGEQPFIENGVTFMPGHVPSSTTSLLTPYFDKNIKEFKGPIPLTIFDLGWQALADSYHAEKKVKTDDIKHNNYTGYPYPDDLTLDYGTWCINYRNFLKTFANPYGWHRFVAWATIHKENVEKIRDASGWMVALRYDVKIRDSAFRMKCSNGVMEGTPDIRKHRKDIEEDCYSDARRFNELGFKMENPYAKGGERADWNPRNGEPKNHSQRQSYNKNNMSNTIVNNSMNGNSSRGNYVNNNHGNRGGSRGGRSGYRGPPELYDPHFTEKKAAAAAARSKNVTT